VSWSVLIDDDFAREIATFDIEMRMELRARIVPLRELGPRLGRPFADTLKGSKHANMKELRFNTANGVWRVAFAFDPARAAILLVAGNKAGVSEKRFYRQLIEMADRRFDAHLRREE
jgi:hypothetical protein